jgi:2-keto-3-deoxy-L-fuconate dehydrogenase
VPIIISIAIAAEKSMNQDKGGREKMQRLKDKIALVTGSGAGIGERICYRFAREGATVVGMDINGSDAERVAATVKAEGGQAYAQSGDVSNKADCIRVVEWVKTNVGSIKVLCNIAGIVEGGTLVDASEESWQRCMDINLKGMYYLCQIVIPEMIKHGGGSIINMSSIAGPFAVKDRGIYMVSKAGVIGLTKSLAIDFIGNGIRANAMCPGTVETPSLIERVKQAPDPEKAMKDFCSRHPIGRLAKPEEIAALAAYLASDESAFMTGQAIAIDGGQSM